MNDTMIDLGPFMRRHDRRSRFVFVVMTATSLLLSAAALGYGMSHFGSIGAIPGRLWFPILFYPLPIIILWAASASMMRKRVVQPDGSMPANPDDARGAERVANAGAVFVAGASLVCIASQMATVLRIFEAVPSLEEGAWFGRGLIVAMGLLMVHFGNAFPRFPTPRGPQHKPAAMIRLNRIYGWMVVIHGLLFILVGLLSQTRRVFGAGTAIVGLSTLLFAIVWMIMYYRTVKSPAAA